MHIESIVLTNFRCFGASPETIDLSPGLTAFVGANGSGKTAVMQALSRLFGVTAEQRRIRRQDFHVSTEPENVLAPLTLSIEAILCFPELTSDDSDALRSVPEFFNQMAIDVDGHLKCRLRLDATWTDDGSLDGFFDAKLRAVRTLATTFDQATECSDLSAADRSRIQMVYVPATRDAGAQVTAFLRSRLWRAINWSADVRESLTESGTALNATFAAQSGVKLISDAVAQRWLHLYAGGTDTTPIFQPVDIGFERFVRNIQVLFQPDEAGRSRPLEDLSDGQRALFHIAMTAAALDIERAIIKDDGETFHRDRIALPSLTLVAVEEPENNLAPFYLARIVEMLQRLTDGASCQAVASSHSASILARVDPVDVRHFRLIPETRHAIVRPIRLPTEADDARKFVREAVRAYPELYFARFVVLGEGSSEEIVLPRVAEALGFPIDRSFVAVVPLGGRHVNHLWKLMNDLEIPFATLLDLDTGRYGGAWGRIKGICAHLLASGTEPGLLFRDEQIGGQAALASFDGRPIEAGPIREWVKHLQSFGVYFCWPLDLDMSMMKAFPSAYQELEPDMAGPSDAGDAKQVVLGEHGSGTIYGVEYDERFRWYRYLFLGRSKPITHLRVLSKLTHDEIRENAPPELKALIREVETALGSVRHHPVVRDQ